jgi:hypothetical protein
VHVDQFATERDQFAMADAAQLVVDRRRRRDHVHVGDVRRKRFEFRLRHLSSWTCEQGTQPVARAFVREPETLDVRGVAHRPITEPDIVSRRAQPGHPVGERATRPEALDVEHPAAGFELGYRQQRAAFSSRDRRRRFDGGNRIEPRIAAARWNVDRAGLVHPRGDGADDADRQGSGG